MCRKWIRADVSRHAAGNLPEALARISARTSVLAFSHDQLFPVADCEADARLIPDGDLHVIESAWGHWGFEMTEAARDALDGHLRALLGR
jgi:homoserine O-acetyltransferase